MFFLESLVFVITSEWLLLLHVVHVVAVVAVVNVFVATAGVCDIPEYCSGTAAQCPPNVFKNQTLCRAAQRYFSLRTHTTHTRSLFFPLTLIFVLCLYSRLPVFSLSYFIRFCDQEELCDGTSALCPPDGFQPVGLVCPDPTNCTAISNCTADGFCVGVDVRCNGMNAQQPFKLVRVVLITTS